MEYIHYGSLKFNSNIFKQVKNLSYSNKPKPGTGLWASPKESNYGWKDWCKQENFRSCKDKNSFTFELDKNAKILIIDNYEDLIKNLNFLKHKEFKGLISIDFEEASKRYDAILLTEKGERNTRITHPKNLYGWDCESILILKSDNIIISY